MKGAARARTQCPIGEGGTGASWACADQGNLRRPSVIGAILAAALLAIPAPKAHAADTSCAGTPATIVGTSGADTITGTGGADVISGMDGNDTINGLGDRDILCGQDGNDTLRGGDSYDLVRGGAGADVLDPGNEQHDTVDYMFSLNPVTIDLNTGTATGQGTDTIESYWQVNGSHFDDTLIGTSTDDWFLGLDGDDLIKGNAGDDHVNGGKGADELRGNWGVDAVYGGLGNDLMLGGNGLADIANYHSTAIDDQLNGTPVDVDLAAGTATGWGTDSLTEFEGVWGTGAADDIAGSAADDDLWGYGGSDVIYGRAGDDFLEGFLGASELYGGADFDTCWGGTVRSSCEASP